MTKMVLLLVALLVGFGSVTAYADTESTYTAPGNEFVEELSVLTGVAITPLLGTSTYGAMQWLNTPEAERERLPWFAQPWFFVPAILLVAVCLLKDTAGIALPAPIKKPMDIIEALEHNISGMIAAGAFVPLLMLTTDHAHAPETSLSSMAVATADLSGLIHLLMVPVSLAAFVMVFLASNAINVLIILSPFTLVDAALKSARLAVLGTVAVSAWASPWIGAMWALVIIAISYFIAGWSFRLSYFGLEFLWDFFTFRSARFAPDPKQNEMFLGREIDGVPTRTYGHLTMDKARQLVFTYRPWLILPERTLILPKGRYVVGKGAFFTEIQQMVSDDTTTALLLPPRYRGDEEKMASIYGFSGVRPIGLLAIWGWLKEALGFRPQLARLARSPRR